MSGILKNVVENFLASAERDQFNGTPAASLIGLIPRELDLRNEIVNLLELEHIDCVFSKRDINMHIRRLPVLAISDQITEARREDLREFSIYPTGKAVESVYDTSKWNDRPFSKKLLIGKSQLDFESFDMAVLERYTADPRYQVHFEDYMGRMSIGDDAFSQMGFPSRDKVSLQTFGLGVDRDRFPYVIVFLRYLANLSPEHQQLWNSYTAGQDVRMMRPYFQSSIEGNFWKNRSARYAIIQEMLLINRMTDAIFGQKIFRDFEEAEVPIGITSFLRPTLANFEAFVLALDKHLSERIDTKFFNGKIEMDEETPRGDNRFEVRRKGSIRLLEDWLLSALKWPDEELVKKVIVGPLKEVRRLRQKPAHEFSKDNFSLEFHRERRRLLKDVLNSLQSMRDTFSSHQGRCCETAA